MQDITKSEMDIMLTLVKSPEVDYNANSLSKRVNITPMGALKIVKRLEKEDILISKKVGNACIYRISLQNEYAKKYISVLLARESLHANARVIRWVQELKKIKNADLILLYGSVLVKDNPNDIDILVVTDNKRFKKLQKEIDELNKINVKKIHPVYQTFPDLIQNIKKRHKPVLNALKGIIVSGEQKFIEVYHESRKE